MLDTARSWLAGTDELARHVDAAPGAWARLETAVREVERTWVRDDFRIFEREWNEVRSETARNEGPLLHRRRYARVAEFGEALSGVGLLDEAQRRVVDGWRATHEAGAALFGRIERKKTCTILALSAASSRMRTGRRSMRARSTSLVGVFGLEGGHFFPFTI